ncbi:MAG TPA: phosphonate ABC transporter, permease protein PhnE [Nitratifractor sp.]|jgi:phosphonate transport system permease protein|nr:phosphonate ABC transporter, permease protein PhnE [Nitratifractor sp.]HHH21059.1 phosphonate ABC transporter, permease protein PhnE [Nitratifractor sp.]
MNSAPHRFEKPSILSFILFVLFVAFLAVSFDGAEISLTNLIKGIPDMGRLVGEMFPPSLDRIDALSVSLLETFEIAVAGTAFGILISLPLAILASKNLSPHPTIYYMSRSLISFFRTVPELIWAIFFVASVGLGPFAGFLAIVVDTIGFAGRFFAEAMEESEKGSQEALEALGASKIDIIFASVIPYSMPSLINTSLYALEKATRSSVVLGLVGAGGIGIELKVSMDMFRYDQAATIIIAIFILVLLVEQVSSRIRRKFIGDKS